MAFTYFGTALRSGSDSTSDTTDGGFVDLVQTAVLVAPLTATPASATLTLPAQAQLLDVTIDRIVAQAGGTATTLPVTVGTAAGDQTYVGTTDMFTVTRLRPTFTVANLAAMGSIGNNRNVVVTVTPNGTTTTAAQLRINVRYVQKV